MKFTVSLNEFQKNLQKVLPAIPPKATLPVLEHLHFMLKDNSLKIVATDQEITIMTTLEVSGESEGAILVPGRRLAEIVKALGSKGDLVFSSKDSNFDIELKTSSGTYDMKGLNPEEYLEMPEHFERPKPSLEEIQASGSDSRFAYFKKDDLVKIANKTIISVSTDEFRPAMTGVLMQFRQNYVNAVSTDSYRLTKSVLRYETPVFPSEIDVIIPAKSMDFLRKVDDDVILTLVETGQKVTHLRFDIGNVVFISRVIDEKFPPYESVIPKNNNLVASIDKSEVLSAVKRVSIFTSSISKQVRLSIENSSMQIKGEDDESGTRADENIHCEFNGEKMEIGFNFKYLEDAVSNLDTEENNNVYITLSEPTKPALIKSSKDGDDLLMLIMPVRLS